MEVLIGITQLLLGLSFLVGIHEAGHMVAAKFFGMRVEKFAIGFPPKIFSFKIGETEYMLGSIPMGGYVKISGMIDESLDTESLKAEPQEWEFRSKPAWQRLIVMLGGIIVNVVAGILIFIAFTYFYGEEYPKAEAVNRHGIAVNDMGKMLGLQRGDKIIAVNGREILNFNDVKDPNYLLEDGSFYTVLRDGETIEIPITKEFLREYTGESADRDFILPLTEFGISEVMPGTPAAQAGLLASDSILTVNGASARYFPEFKRMLNENAGKTITLGILREAQPKDLSVNVSEQGTIGFGVKPYIETERTQYPLGEAIVQGTGRAFSVIYLQLKAFRKMGKGEVSASESLSGPIGMVKIYGYTWDWTRFWMLTATLSMVLAFMNLLPIPALDGGHVMFLLYEMITGKAPSDKFLEAAQKVGLVLILALIIFIFGNDIYKLLRGFF
ncbi:MAG: RIP metalloprotease RseP [Bernardetiaceae bacterium]|nr:RIP metalloprotease RseP [Bernardetiaceae bacterium]